MGLKKTNYSIETFGLELPNVYARITSLHVDLNGKAFANFEIQQTREDIGQKEALERKYFNCEVNVDLPIHKQVYEAAKEELFVDWTDDIVE